MLDFYLGTGGINNLGKYLGGISSDGIFWLQKNGFIKMGKTGHLPNDSPESLPYFDDVVLSIEQVKQMYNKCKLKMNEAQKTPGFKNSDVDTLLNILATAIEANSGLSTLCD